MKMINYDTFAEHLLIKPNQQQEMAIKAVNGPTLLLAVPGSGKTTTLVTRLGYMIFCEGIEPSRILTLTYTVAATNDMKQRFAKMFGNEFADRLEFKTINSVSAGIIKQYGKMIGKPSFALEDNEKTLLGVISALYQRYEGEYPTESDVKGVRTHITYIKNMMLSEAEIMELDKETGINVSQIYAGYCTELKRRRRMDFDDQMVYAYNLLKKSPELLQFYQDKYHYICVDEAQDTSKIQHKIIELLASANKNLFMVGDEDQSIYGFRAAYPEALLNFEKTYKDAKVLLMEENFRSNAHIVNAANDFIQKNTARHKKEMRATRMKSSKIEEIKMKNREDQYAYLLGVAKMCDEQTAVLYRDNESAIPLVDILDRNGLSYKIRKAELSFFTNRVVLDIQNMMRFAMDPKDTALFESIYYKLTMYLNKENALKASRIAREMDISVFDAIYSCLDLESYVVDSIKEVERNFNKLNYETPYLAINRLMNYMGYGEYLKRASISDKKVFILKAIGKREKNLQSFLDRIEELRAIIEDKSDIKESNFILSTIHASKGLEYDTVYLIDVIDGIFPEEPPRKIDFENQDSRDFYEEERRLFYVGVTRAKNKLHLIRTSKDSAFIDQLIHKAPAVSEDPKPNKFTTVKIGSVGSIRASSSGKFANDIDSFAASLTAGKSVRHKKFGTGHIISKDKENVRIEFGHSTKTFNMRLLCEHGLLEM